MKFSFNSTSTTTTTHSLVVVIRVRDGGGRGVLETRVAFPVSWWTAGAGVRSSSEEQNTHQNCVPPGHVPLCLAWTRARIAAAHCTHQSPLSLDTLAISSFCSQTTRHWIMLHLFPPGSREYRLQSTLRSQQSAENSRIGQEASAASSAPKTVEPDLPHSSSLVATKHVLFNHKVK